MPVAKAVVNDLWHNLKKNPKYWVMVSASMIAVPSCAISTGIQKYNSYPQKMERENQRMMRDISHFEKYWNK